MRDVHYREIYSFFLDLASMSDAIDGWAMFQRPAENVAYRIVYTVHHKCTLIDTARDIWGRRA